MIIQIPSLPVVFFNLPTNSPNKNYRIAGRSFQLRPVIYTTSLLSVALSPFLLQPGVPLKMTGLLVSCLPLHPPGKPTKRTASPPFCKALWWIKNARFPQKKQSFLPKKWPAASKIYASPFVVLRWNKTPLSFKKKNNSLSASQLHETHEERD